MSFDLSEFLTEGLISSINNGLIQPELATVYAGNYLAKSLIIRTRLLKCQTRLLITRPHKQLSRPVIQIAPPLQKVGKVTKGDQMEDK